jgi:hypothetical protein
MRGKCIKYIYAKQASTNKRKIESSDAETTLKKENQKS